MQAGRPCLVENYGVRFPGPPRQPVVDAAVVSVVCTLVWLPGPPSSSCAALDKRSEGALADMTNQRDTTRCRERVVWALAVAQSLAALGEDAGSCDHYPCALLGRQASQAAAELRRAAARAGLKLAGLRLLQVPASSERDEGDGVAEAPHDIGTSTSN